MLSLSLKILLFLMFFSCIESSSPLLLPEMNKDEKLLKDLLSSKKISGLKYHHVSLKNEDVVVIVSYPEWSKKKVQLLGRAVNYNATNLFNANQDILQITFYVANGSVNSSKKHFIGLTRSLWENPPLILTDSDNPLMAYEIAETYYVGTNVSGTLSFRKENQDISLPPRKPMS